MKTEPLPFTHPVAVATLGGSEHLVLEPDAATRAAIARHLGLHALERFVARLEIQVGDNGLVTVSGTIAADLQPICVVTLEPFPQHVEEAVAVRFAPAPLIERMIRRAEEDEIEDFEPPDEIEGGTIDFGALAVEFLALSLDPYPRKPGAEFAGLAEEGGAPSPFEALKALKPGGGGTGA